MKTEHDFECDVIVIGAGVIGLAVARKLQLEGRDVILLERNDAFGMETQLLNKVLKKIAILSAIQATELQRAKVL